MQTADVRMRAKYVTTVHASTRNVAARWREQHEERGGSWYNEEKKAIYDGLVALGKAPDPDEVAKIIGNKSWSYLTCDGCSEHSQSLICIGEWEAKNYCPTCISEAAILAKSFNQP